MLCDPEAGLYAAFDGECCGGLAGDVAVGCLRERHVEDGERDDASVVISLGQGE